MDPTTSEFDLRDTAAVCDLFDRAAEVQLQTAGRRGSVVELGETGRVLITGDLHDHRDHFERILKLSRINYSENYHLVLQELIHGEHLVNGMDFSYRMLAQSAELKLSRPNQVHHLLSNHELAQRLGEGILKDSVSVTEAFDAGLEFIFGDDAEAVQESIGRYVRSMPLAVRCANGVFCSHSLPTPRRRGSFDEGVLNRELTEADLTSPDGSAYLMVWGRQLTQSLADDLAECWGVEQFVLGHQHADMGWEEIGESILILNSDHNHGVALPVELSKKYSRDELTEQIIPLAAVL